MKKDDDHAHNNLSEMDEEELLALFRRIIRLACSNLQESKQSPTATSNEVNAKLTEILIAVNKLTAYFDSDKDKKEFIEKQILDEMSRNYNSISSTVNEISRKMETPIKNQSSIAELLQQFKTQMHEINEELTILNALHDQCNKNIMCFATQMQANSNNKPTQSTIIENNTDNKIR